MVAISYGRGMNAHLERPQPLIHVVSLHRGRGVGGSSTVNFMFWDSPPAQDLDNWERLGATDWNWETFKEARKRVET